MTYARRRSGRRARSCPAPGGPRSHDHAIGAIGRRQISTPKQRIVGELLPSPVWVEWSFKIARSRAKRCDFEVAWWFSAIVRPPQNTAHSRGRGGAAWSSSGSRASCSGTLELSGAYRQPGDLAVGPMATRSCSGSGAFSKRQAALYIQWPCARVTPRRRRPRWRQPGRGRGHRRAQRVESLDGGAHAR